MASLLKVDSLTGVTTAGSISVTGEGNSTTTNLQSGLVKCLSRFNSSTNAVIGSFNQSSRTDDGTGLSTTSFTNNMGNANYFANTHCSVTAAPTTGHGAFCDSAYSETTSSVGLAYGYSGSSSGTAWAFHDFDNIKFLLHGDLA
jgi:hypothetical protein